MWSLPPPIVRPASSHFRYGWNQVIRRGPSTARVRVSFQSQAGWRSAPTPSSAQRLRLSAEVKFACVISHRRFLIPTARSAFS